MRAEMTDVSVINAYAAGLNSCTRDFGSNVTSRLSSPSWITREPAATRYEVWPGFFDSWLAAVVPNKENSSIAKRVVETTIREAPMKSFEHTLTHHSRGDGAELCRVSGERRLQATPPNQALV